MTLDKLNRGDIICTLLFFFKAYTGTKEHYGNFAARQYRDQKGQAIGATVCLGTFAPTAKQLAKL